MYLYITYITHPIQMYEDIDNHLHVLKEEFNTELEAYEFALTDIIKFTKDSIIKEYKEANCVTDEDKIQVCADLINQSNATNKKNLVIHIEDGEHPFHSKITLRDLRSKYVFF